MKRTYFPGLIDTIVVDDAEAIRELAKNPEIDRAFAERKPLLNALLLAKILGALSFYRRRFPTMQAREAAGRQTAQDMLWQRTTDRAEAIRVGPAELDGLAGWIQHPTSTDDLGILVQQVVGSLFSDRYTATPETWSAALVLDAAPRLKNIGTIVRWRILRKAEKAKSTLAKLVDGDLAGVHATGVALHNIVRGLEHMHTIYADEGLRAAIAVDDVVNRCLFAPAMVLRQPTTKGAVKGCPFSRKTIILYALAAANAPGDRSITFLNESWSRCPAEKWVPALLEGIWRRAFVSAPDS